MRKQITETLIAFAVAAVTATTGISAAHASIKMEAEPQTKTQETVQRASFMQDLEMSIKPVTADPQATVSFHREGMTSKPKPKPKVEEKPVEVKPVEEPAPATASTPSAPTAPVPNTPVAAPAIPVATGSAGDHQRYAAEEMTRRGMNGASELSCLIPLWEKESNWNANAANPTSSARGIPQMMMNIHFGADWQTNAAGVEYLTNPHKQVQVGLDYIQGRYGTPCNALAIWNTQHWY